jgi:GNAT superfamily N-acetyltransferase
MSELSIRPATAADAATLARHRVAMFRDMRAVRPDDEAALLAASQRYLERALVSGEYLGWLALSGREVAGGAGVQRRPLLPRPGRGGAGIAEGVEGLVLNVYVEPAFRRRGIARMLMEHIITWAPGAAIARLSLHASDEGRALYEALGFTPTNEMHHTAFA